MQLQKTAAEINILLEYKELIIIQGFAPIK